jgi:hypothetical protein
MPASAKLTSDGILFLELTGAPDLAGVEAAITAALAGPGRPAPLVLDVRQARLNPSGDQVREHAEYLHAQARRGLLAPCVALVAAGSLQTGIANMLSTYAEFRGVRVTLFGDLEEAFAWARSTRRAS